MADLPAHEDGRWERAAFLGSLAVAIGVLWWARLRFWYPHDEGALAQAALRVLQGEVPHREFAHPYTGADAVLHGAFFRLVEPSLAGIRTGFAALASLWFLFLATWFRRHAGAASAAVFVLVLGAFGVATYPAAMPSWYVTMLVTSAVVLLARPGGAAPTRARLIGAGVALGLALSFKVTALYAVVGIVAWLFVDVRATGTRPARPWVIALMVLAAIAALLLLVPTATPRTAVHLLLPPLAVAAWVVALELRQWRRVGPGLARDTMVAPALLTGGILLGAAPTFLWLGLTGGLAGFLDSIREVGGLRAEFAGAVPPSLASLPLALPYLATVGLARLRTPPRWWVVAVPCVALFALTWTDYTWHRWTWQGMRGAMVIGIVVALLVSARSLPARPRPWLLAVTTLGWMVLSQYPFAAVVYFVYVAPLALMGLIALGRVGAAGRRVLATVGVALAAFGYFQVVPATPGALGWSRMPGEHLARLPGAHGGLLVPVGDSIMVGRVLEILADSVPPGPIWVGPDAPEIAFLAGRRDLNPAFFGFLGAAGDADAMRGAAALVIRRLPSFSPPPTEAQLAEWQRRHPRRVDIEPFTVLWGGTP